MEILGTGDVLRGGVARVDDRLAGAVRAQTVNRRHLGEIVVIGENRRRFASELTESELLGEV